jgi:hypothetical protein
MSYQNRLTEWMSIGSPDVVLAKFGLLLSVLLLGLRLVASQVLLVMIPLATGSACALYVATREGTQHRVNVGFAPRRLSGYAPALVVLGLAGLLLLTQASGGRTLEVYLLTAGIGTAILGQILFVEESQLSAPAVLAQLLLAAVLIRLSALYVTPGFVGVDIWTHVPVWVDGIASQGSFDPIADSKYVMAPLYHSVGAVGALVFGDARTGVYLTLGVLIPVSALLVYATARLFVATRWALLATALFAFGDQFIRWGLHVIPTSLGLVFFLAALYCLTRLFVHGDAWSGWLLLSFSLAVVFTHQMSTAVILLVLGIATFVAVKLRLSGASNDDPLPPATTLAGVFTATLAVTVASWASTPWSENSDFLSRMLLIAELHLEDAAFLNLASEGTASVVIGDSGGTIHALVPYIELVGFALLLSAAVIGGLRLLCDDRMFGLSRTYVFAAGTMFVIVFGLSLFGFRVLLPGRWLAFLYAPMAIIGAVGLSHLARNSSRRLLVAVFVLLALCYPATMVVAEKATLDSPAFENEHPRFAHTQAEISGVETISAVRPDTEQTYYTDHPFRTLTERRGGLESARLAVGSGGTVSQGPIVYREYQSSGPVEFNPPPEAAGTVSIDAVTESLICSPGRNVVYANDEVRLCTISTVSEEGST